MQSIDLLVVPRYLIPVAPAGKVDEQTAMAVHDGRIIELLPADQAREKYMPAETLALKQHAVMPGLVNAHTHSAMSLFRGLADDLPLMQWLNDHIWPAEGAHANAEFCRDGVALAIAEMIRSGTTCFNDMYFFPEATAEVAGRAGIRVCIGLIVIDFPSAWARPGEYLHKGLAFRDAVRDQPLIKTLFAPHAPYSVNDTALAEVRKYANELGVGIHMHVHETADEVQQAQDNGGARPWQRLRDLDLPGSDFVAVHMTQLNDEEIEQAAALGVHVAHCPESNLKLASGFCPVAKLMQAGVNVCLGTDGAASNNDLDLFGEMRTAALLAKGVSGDAQSVSAPQALQMATINGARALGLDQDIGSLEVGKSADFIAVDLSACHTQPLFNPISQLVYAANGRDVTHSFVAGRALMRNRTLSTIDEPAILGRAAQWRQRICGAEQ
ncbi:MAG: TRZ/ATZ family hydrolase [Panacagrimonas sp.]